MQKWPSSQNEINPEGFLAAEHSRILFISIWGLLQA